MKQMEIILSYNSLKIYKILLQNESEVMSVIIQDLAEKSKLTENATEDALWELIDFDVVEVVGLDLYRITEKGYNLLNV